MLMICIMRFIISLEDQFFIFFLSGCFRLVLLYISPSAVRRDFLMAVTCQKLSQIKVFLPWYKIQENLFKVDFQQNNMSLSFFVDNHDMEKTVHVKMF